MCNTCVCVLKLNRLSEYGPNDLTDVLIMQFDIFTVELLNNTGFPFEHFRILAILYKCNVNTYELICYQPVST